MNARQRILVKKAEMLALHNRYVAAMRAGQKAIEKIASDEMAKQAMYRNVYRAIKGLKRR